MDVGVRCSVSLIAITGHHTCKQDEVARRLVAGPDGRLDYRAMNLEVAFYSKPTYLFEVDRTAYFPEPNVDGAVVEFELRTRHQYLLQEDMHFLNLVRCKSMRAWQRA